MEERQITTKKDEWREGDALKGLDRVQLTIYSYIQSLLLWSLLVLAFAEMWRKSSNYFFLCIHVPFSDPLSSHCNIVPLHVE